MAVDAAFLRDLCNLEIPGEIRLSPDESHVLYSTSLTWGSRQGPHAVSTIWLANTTQALSAKQLTSGLCKDFAPCWHPSGKYFIFVSDRSGPGSKWAIYKQDVNNVNEPKAITPQDNEQAIQLFGISPDGRYAAYLSADEKSAAEREREKAGDDAQVWGYDWRYSRLRIVNFYTEEIQTVSFDEHVTDLCWDDDASKIGIVSCKTTEFEEPFIKGSSVSILDCNSMKIQRLCHFPGAVQDLHWANGHELCFRSSVPIGAHSGGQGVYVVDSTFQNPEFKHLAFGNENDAVTLAKFGKEVFARVEHWLEDRIANLSGDVIYAKKQVIESFAIGLRNGSEPRKVVVATSDVNTPVEVYVTTDGGATMLQLSNHGLQFRDRKFGICHFLSSASADGLVEIDSLYLEPSKEITSSDPTIQRKPLPTVVLIHGGPVTRITNAFNTYYYMMTPYLLSQGFGVLLPNYRGSSGRGQAFASFSVGGLGKYDMEDIISTTQSAIEQGLADPTRLIVGGYSHGGLLTNLCCVRNGLHGKGWRFNAAITGASMCDLDSMALTSDMGSSYQPGLHQGRVVWNMDISDTKCREASALWAFKSTMARSEDEGIEIIPPMLIVHGAEDKRCPVSQAWGLRRALEHYSLPFELVVYPRQGHAFHEQTFWIDMNLRIGRWCKKYTGSRDE